jgi:hypothetical protein
MCPHVKVASALLAYKGFVTMTKNCSAVGTVDKCCDRAIFNSVIVYQNWREIFKYRRFYYDLS